MQLFKVCPLTDERVRLLANKYLMNIVDIGDFYVSTPTTVLNITSSVMKVMKNGVIIILLVIMIRII